VAADPPQPRRFRRFLRGTFHHYSAGFPERVPWLLDRVFSLFFSRLEISESDREKIARKAGEGVLLYALPNPSRLEYLHLAYALRKLGLPAPAFGHYLSVYMIQPLVQTFRRLVAVLASLATRRTYPNPYRDGYVRELLAKGTPTVLFLRQFRGLPRRFFREQTDPLVAILRAAADLDRRVLVVPVFLLYGKKLPREAPTLVDLFLGPADEPGRLRSLAIFLRHFRKAVLRAGKTIDAEAFVEEHAPRVAYSTERTEEIAYLLRKEALARIDVERRVAVGPALKYRSELIEAAVQDEETRREIHAYSAEKKIPYAEGRRLVRRYLDEVAADPDSLVVGLLDRLLTRFIRRNYAGLVVDEPGLDRVRKASRAAPVVYVPSHKSHMDYLLASYVLYHHHVSLPYVAAGVNLSFWPVGPIFRRAGAFFLRRSFKGAPLYPLAFAKYVEGMLREGYNLEFFIEGGRSRTGKLGIPKLGFLSIVLDAARKAALSELVFVPVMITYERVLEDAYYFREQSGAPKPPENLRSMVQGRRVLARKQGKVYVDFAEPIALSAFLAGHGVPALPATREGTMDLAGALARVLVLEMSKRGKVSPYALVAAAVLSTEKRGIYLADIRRRVSLLVRYLVPRGVPFTEPVDTASFWPDPILAVMEAEGTVRADPGERGDDILYYVAEDQRLNLCFYKNTLVHHLQYPALLAVALLRQGPAAEESLWEDYRALRRMLRREFILPGGADGPADREAGEFDEALAYFRDAGFLDRADGRVFLQRGGEEAARLLASLIASFLESYFLAFHAVRRLGPGTVPEREIHRRALKAADRMFSTGEITRKESKNKLIFETALGFLEKEGVLAGETRAVGRGKRFERTYAVKDTERLERLVAEIAPFLAALH
jgi:glycerol-3-phosphate O-acyltransferase